jgi:hypothetical protein
VCLQYSAQLADNGLFAQAFAYVLACISLANKAKGDRRATGHAYEPEALLAMAQELHARLQAHAAAMGVPQGPSSRGLMSKVGTFLDNKVMKLLAADVPEPLHKSSSTTSLGSQSRRQSGVCCLGSLMTADGIHYMRHAGLALLLLAVFFVFNIL